MEELSVSRFIKSNSKQRFTLGIVYEPMEEDSQGDFASADEIEKACHKFMKYIQGNTSVNKMALKVLDSIVKSVQDGDSAKLDVTDIWEELTKSGNPLGLMHEEWDEAFGDIVECYCSPTDFDVEKADGTLERVKKGTWLLGCIWNPDMFQKVESGELTGLSMGGSGKRIPVKEVG